MDGLININERNSLRVIIESYYAAMGWLNNLSSSKVVNGRFRHYLDVIQKAESSGYFQVNQIEFYHACLEAMTLIQIHQETKEHADGELTESIKHLIKGQNYRYDGIALNRTKGVADSCRNFSFELLTASRFSRLGYKVKLNHVCDVVFSVDECRVFVECKRIVSEKQIIKNIKDAEKQLGKRIGHRKASSVGVVFLDITDIVNPDCVGFVTDTRQEMFDFYYELIMHFIASNKYKIERAAKKYTSAISFVVNALGYSREDESVISGQVVISAKACWNTLGREDITQKIIDSMKKNNVCTKPAM